MKQTIRFRGLSLNGDEQAAEHGDLSLCGNIELHDGALRQLQVYGPSLGGGNSLDGKVLFVHQTSSYTHFITSISGSLYWTEENDDHTSWKTEEIVVNSVTIESLRSINAIGNTLCILSETGLHYCLFKDGSYKYLGQQPPFLDIQFNLHLVDDGNTETITAKYDVESGGIISKEDDYAVTLGNDMIEFLNQDCKTSITEQVLAAINKRIDEKSGDGLFYAPFFVRYCYHLYDNSMIMHSCPVLMMPMLQHPVLTAIRGAMYKAENKYHAVNEFTDNELEFCVFVLCGKLQMKFLSNIVSDLKEWGDIVKSVDIFISNQFSRIDTSKPIEKINYLNEAEGIWSHFDGAQIQVGDYSGSSGLFHRTYPEFSVGDRTFYSACSFVLPEYGIEEYLSRIRGVSSFFKLASLNVDSLEHISNFTDVVFSPSASLRSITTQDQMTDDYKTHNKLMPYDKNSGLYNYNHRLNVFGISEELFEGFDPGILFPYCSTGDSVDRVEVWIQTENGLKYVRKKTASRTISQRLLYYGYIFYPDSRAIRMRFNNSNYFQRDIEDAPGLNGAVAFYNNNYVEQSRPALDTSGGNISPMPNKIYTSKADNPFYFPNLPDESGINTVGVGNIIGIAAVTRALSQGQVGDHDLAIFSSDGIWVLKVSPTGTYSGMHNISREVCVNKDSICQMDQSILFATNRSLQRFVESDCVSVSEVLDGPLFDIVTNMPEFKNYIHGNAPGLDPLVAFNTLPLDFFVDGQELYDYAGMRVFVFPKNIGSGGVALVYSIRDKSWATVTFPALKAVVNSYPTPYIQNGSGVVFSLDKPYYYNVVDPMPGIIVTRTLTFSDTMDVLRGFSQYGDCKNIPILFFYGSNDQRVWKYIGTSARAFHNYMPGHPFRFFRIGVYFNMYAKEKYQQLELEVINKYFKL